METRIIVSAIIEDGNGRFLFGRKPPNIGPYPNTWHLIGGGLNHTSESAEEELKREIREEAGIEVDIIEKMGFDEDIESNKYGIPTHYIFLVYRVRFKSGIPTSSDDIQQLAWFSIADLSTIELPRPSKKLFTLLGYL